MARYRKKPVVIEAVTVRSYAGADHPAWLTAAMQDGTIQSFRDGVKIKTPEGFMIGGIDDWIICGIAGELYPCKPDIFEKHMRP